MEAIYKLTANEVDQKFLENIRRLFGNKRIKITIEPDLDETEYLLEAPANEYHIKGNIKSKKETRFSGDELKDFVEKKLKK